MTSSAVLSSRPPSSHFHFAPHHHHHHHRRRRNPIPSSLSQTPVSRHPEPQQTQLSRSILSNKLGKKPTQNKTKGFFFKKKIPTRSTDIPQESAFQRKMQSIEERIAGNDKCVQNAKASEE
jgi:hypothetical protein